MKNNAGLLRGLQYFETVARHNSVKSAARELGVTASAVSRQLRELTASLGEQLVVRAGRGIALTPTGRQLANKLAEAFANLEHSILGVVGAPRPQLRLAVCTSFGPGWLAGRLPDFYRVNPDINIELRLYTEDPAQSDQVADAFVTAHPVATGYVSVRLFEENLVAVHAPGGCGEKTRRLITTDLDAGQEGRDWREFAAQIGISPGEATVSYRRTTHFFLALEMAKARLGVALVPDFLAERDLDSGALQLAYPNRAPSDRTYRLCYKESRANEPAITAFASWLRTQGVMFARRMRVAQVAA